MKRRSFILGIAIGLALTALSFNVEGRVSLAYPWILGCEQGCEFVAAGFPFPFVADGPQTSPAGSVSLVMALLGEERILWERLAASLAFWLVASQFAVWAASRFVLTRRAV